MQGHTQAHQSQMQKHHHTYTHQPVYTYLSIMIPSPLNFLQQVTQIMFEWNVVFPWRQAFVEVFIVLRVLLQY